MSMNFFNLHKYFRPVAAVLCSVAAIAFGGTVFTAGAEPKHEVEAARDAALDELTFTDMLKSVELDKYGELVQKYQAKEAKNHLLNGIFTKKGQCGVESYRNKEVLLITIPAKLLFEPNSTELKGNAHDYLSPLKRYLRDPDMYRVLLVMHTDNTGSEVYRDELTAERADAVFDWFVNNGSNTSYLFPYALGDDMPLVPNDSFEHRDSNRRLEVYLMPGEKMLKQAKTGRISF